VVAFSRADKVSVRNTLTKYCLLCHKKRAVSRRIALHQKFFIPARNAQTFARSQSLASCRADCCLPLLSLLLLPAAAYT